MVYALRFLNRFYFVWPFFLSFLGALRLGKLVSPNTRRAGGLLDKDVDFFPDRVVHVCVAQKLIRKVGDRKLHFSCV